MSDSIILTCQSCGEKLDIAQNIDLFACAQCGREYIVNRSGGIVSLSTLPNNMQNGGLKSVTSQNIKGDENITVAGKGNSVTAFFTKIFSDYEAMATAYLISTIFFWLPVPFLKFLFPQGIISLVCNGYFCLVTPITLAVLSYSIMKKNSKNIILSVLLLFLTIIGTMCGFLYY